MCCSIKASRVCKQKIAILATGQVRNEDGIKNVADFAQGKTSPLVVVSTWSTKGRKTSGSLNYSQLSRLLSEELASLIPADLWERKFNTALNWYSQEEIARPVTRDDFDSLQSRHIIDIESSELLSLQGKQAAFDKNSTRMLYKVWRSIELLEKQEASTNTNHSFILKCRLDQAFPSGFLSSEPEDENIVYVDFLTEDACGDCIVFGHRNIVLPAFRNLFGRVVDSTSQWEGIHVELKKELEKRGGVLRVPQYCPVLLEDNVNISLLSSVLRNRSNVNSSRAQPEDDSFLSREEANVIDFCIGTVDKPVRREPFSVIQSQVQSFKDIAGIANLVATIDCEHKDNWTILGSACYLFYISVDFACVNDRFSRRWLVWNGIKILASQGLSLESIQDSCLQFTKNPGRLQIGEHLEARAKDIISDKALIDPWRICVKDYEVAREVCAIYDRAGMPEVALKKALTFSLDYRKTKKDLSELIMHLYNRCKLHKECIDYFKEYARMHDDSEVIKRTLTEARTHLQAG